MELQRGDEILISYLSGEDLLRPTWMRRKELQRGPWKFHCECSRCERVDDVRGMLCQRCGRGCHWPLDKSWSCCEFCQAEADKDLDE
eukprot:symbB.v1.2.041710.t1/scaffold8535.1/size5995/1